MTHKSIDELANPSYVALVRAHCTEVVEGRVPITHFHDRSYITLKAPHDCEILALPLSGDGKTIDMLIIGYEYKE
jgi:hypothetical protein